MLTEVVRGLVGRKSGPSFNPLGLWNEIREMKDLLKTETDPEEIEDINYIISNNRKKSAILLEDGAKRVAYALGNIKRSSARGRVRHVRDRRAPRAKVAYINIHGRRDSGSIEEAITHGIFRHVYNDSGTQSILTGMAKSLYSMD